MITFPEDNNNSSGKVIQVVGNIIESEGPAARIGELCHIHCGDTVARAEVVGFRAHIVLLMALDEIVCIQRGDIVIASGKKLMISVGKELIGRVIDPFGNSIDGKGPIQTESEYPLDVLPPNPNERTRIHEPLSLGVKAIDALLTCGIGQRMGVFSGSGVGKSTLMGMISRNTSADVIVIGLIGDRGREVLDFIEKDLGPEGLKRSVIIAVTSDQSALLRVKGAFAATAVAEYFRDQGLNVLMMMDSVTNFAMAKREIGLAIGEQPATNGYTPSVYALLPKLLERTGTSSKGSITGLYTVLVEGDDYNEPISDLVRSILDGHIFLSREIASKNHYPAIDVLYSVSRLAIEITSPEHNEANRKLRQILATYNNAKDLINIGAYIKGNNPEIDYAFSKIDSITTFLKQTKYEVQTLEESIQELFSLLS